MNNFFSIPNGSEILGMNSRNYSYQRLNHGNKKYADNKLISKKLLKRNNIPTPEVFGIIRNRKDVELFNYDNLPKSFVLKPAKGVKGAGINIYYNRLNDGRWVLADKNKHDVQTIKTQSYNILDGQYSLGTIPKPSSVIFEERVKMHPAFKQYSYRGIPDIRVIVYNKIPVMAMLRLPTKESEGKANLSRGAIGVGIDMARGVTTSAIKKSIVIENVPGKNLSLSGIKIPYWNKILKISHQCQVASGLKFVGVDIIIDKEKGPMVVELNARPGLGIQAANQDGLKDRLEKVKKVKNVTESKAVRLAKDLFGGEIDDELESITGREVIGLVENVVFIDKKGKEITVKCKVDTGAESSSMDKCLAAKLGFEDAISAFEKAVDEYNIMHLNKRDRARLVRSLEIHEDIVSLVPIRSASGDDYRMRIELPGKIKDREISLRMNIADRSDLNYPVLLGKRDLKNFLIDTTKR